MKPFIATIVRKLGYKFTRSHILFLICVLGLRIAKWAAVKQGYPVGLLADAEGAVGYNTVRHPKKVEDGLLGTAVRFFYEADSSIARKIASSLSRISQ